MNQELERKLKNNEQAKALFLEYKSKEDKIKKMLKEYENAKENGATMQELSMLKKAIKGEQQPLLESFYKYKELENKANEKKQEVPVKPISRENQIKSAKKIVNVQEKNDKIQTEQVAQIKVMPIRKLKELPRKEQLADIIPISKKRSIEKTKKSSSMKRKLQKTRKTSIKRPIATRKKTLKSNIVTMSKIARIKRRMARNIKRKMKSHSKKQQVRRYRAIKNKNQFIERRKSKTITNMLKKKMKAVRKFLGSNGSPKKKKDTIEPPTKKRHKRQFTMFDMYRGTVQNWDGHIEANANRKIEQMPDKDQKQGENELNAIGWR